MGVKHVPFFFLRSFWFLSSSYLSNPHCFSCCLFFLLSISLTQISLFVFQSAHVLLLCCCFFFFSSSHAITHHKPCWVYPKGLFNCKHLVGSLQYFTSGKAVKPWRWSPESKDAFWMRCETYFQSIQIFQLYRSHLSQWFPCSCIL